MHPSEIPKIFVNVEQIYRYSKKRRQLSIFNSVNQEVLTALDIALEKNAIKEKGLQKVMTDVSKAFINNVAFFFCVSFF